MGCTGLRTVIIGSGVTEIEDGSTNGYDEAFRDCSGVTDVYCYAPSATMTWAKNSNTTIFKSSKATRELCELRNMINVGYLITRQAMERKESRGLHFSIDYPKDKG